MLDKMKENRAKETNHLHSGGLHYSKGACLLCGRATQRWPAVHFLVEVVLEGWMDLHMGPRGEWSKVKVSQSASQPQGRSVGGWYIAHLLAGADEQRQACWGSSASCRHGWSAWC